jgi:uncharacterized protein (DUF885 family)
MKGLIIAACAVGIGWFSLPALAGPAEDLDQLFADEWANRLQENPLFATFAGEPGYDHLMPSATPAAHARRAEQDAGYLDRLHGIESGGLSASDQLNYDLFDFVLSHRVKSSVYRAYRIPFVSDSGFFSNVTFAFQRARLRTPKDYENYIARLEAMPRWFAEHTQNMRRGLEDDFTMPSAILGNIEPIIGAMASQAPEETIFLRPFNSLPDHFGEAESQRLVAAAKRAIEEGVMPAYKAFHAFFRDEYMPGARKTLGATELPGGKDYYEYLVSYFTTLDITPEEVHQLGLDEVARIRAEMETIIEQVGFEGTFKEFLTFLRTDPQFYAETPEQLLKEASWIAKQIDGQMPAFFGRLPRMPYGVAPVPEHLAPNYTTGRYVGSRPGATRGGYYWVNTYALDKRPLYALPALTLHEGVPGHHHQGSISQEMENVPKFRQGLYPHAFGEGWGLYSEKLGIEMGVYKTPYENFGRLTYEMWRAGRLVVDTGMHVMGWSRERAVALFVENSALSVHNINTEVDRYISWPGQALAYKMGELTILRLRREASEALGAKFDIRRFHDAVLAAGGIPLNILEARIAAFIKAEQAAE